MYFTCRDLTHNSSSTSWSYFYQSSENSLCLLIKLSSKTPNPRLSQVGQQLLSNILKNPSKLNIDTLQNLDPGLILETLIFAKLTKPNHINLTALGKANVILKRNGQISTILHHSGSIIKNLTGSVFSQDQILFSDQDFLDQHPWSEVKHKFSGLETQSPATTAAFLQIQQITVSQPPIRLPNIKIFLLVALFLTLILSLYFYRKSHTPEAKLSQISRLINNALSLKALNPSSSQSLAKKAEDILLSLKKSGYQNPDLAQYQADIDSLLSVSQKPNSPTPSPQPSPSPSNSSLDLFYDLTAINKQASYTTFTLANGKIYLLDSKNRRLDQLSLEDKITQPFLKGSSLENLTLLASNQSAIYLGSNTSLYLADGQGLSVKAKFSSPSLTVSPSQVAFWNNTLYVLDTQSRQIFKYLPNSKGFDQPLPWLNSKEKLSVSTQSFAIDSFVWTLNSSGSVNQYLKGEKQNFKLESDPASLQSSNLIVPVSQDKLAFITDGKIVVLYDKQGKLLQKYTSQENILGLLYYNNSLLILTEDQKIYQVKL